MHEPAERAHSWLTRSWRRASLVQRLVLMALLPSVVSTILLAMVLTRHQIMTLDQVTRSTAEAYVTHAATAAIHPLQHHDLPELHRIADSISQLPHVTRVDILDHDGTPLANAGSKTPSETNQVQLEHVIADPDDPHMVAGTLQAHIDTNAAEAQRAGILNTMFWLGIAILFAIVLSWQQARWISAPVRRLSEAMHGLGTSDPPLEVDVTDESEIGELERGFNTAARTLHALHTDMQHRIQEATEKLAQKNIALEQASKAKARFLAGATHDLRQPLYALTLFSSSLAEKETSPERLDRIAHVQECIESLDRLFSELLDLSRLETGMMQPTFSHFALDELFQEVSRNFRMLAEQHDLRLITRATNAWVRSDRIMLGRILNNLVSNALRYTHRGGVLVGARRRGDNIRIEVRDTGIGIAPEHHAHVFEEFYRIEHAASKDESGKKRSDPRGLGLGLSTVQKLAGLIETQVTLHSHPGRGTLFTLVVPSCTQPKIHHTTGRKHPGSTHLNLLKNARVLVIDDDVAILAGIRDLLQSWGCRALMAEASEDLREVVGEWDAPPDIVISDLHLGNGDDGIQALHLLAKIYAADPDNPPFARLLVTGETDRERLEPALQSGVPILFKPVACGPLREALIALLRTRGKPAP